ncbi:MAG: hypothetical protein Q4D56_12800 [Bacteroides sp.]|nr:hypothetical protein [Bacteroides sp.]
MDLKDFIKETVRDISGAVTELNEEMKGTGLKVNPKRGGHFAGTMYDDDDHVIHTIDFNLQVTASEKLEAGGGIKINVLKAGVSNETNDQTVSTIHFSLEVVLPNP